jgi:AraC-like DNA-binding protein
MERPIIRRKIDVVDKKRTEEGAGMTTGLYTEIDEVIDYIHRHILDPLPLSRLAGHVSYSPYHFTRIFKERMGLSPLYYVSALRLQKAKDLLLQTNLSIRDIGLEIGQQSLGTFTTRFTERVGVTPSQFRNSKHQADHLFRSLQQLNDWHTPHIVSSQQHASIRGTVQATHPFNGIILIGLFAKPIPEGMPIHGTLISGLGDFSFTGYVGSMGNAGDGLSASAYNLAHQIEGAHYRKALYSGSASAGYALPAQRGRSSHSDFPSRVDE